MPAFPSFCQHSRPAARGGGRAQPSGAAPGPADASPSSTCAWGALVPSTLMWVSLQLEQSGVGFGERPGRPGSERSRWAPEQTRRGA